MNIGVDARPLSIGYGGIYRMLISIIREMERIDGENSYRLYNRGDFALPFENPRWQKRIHPGIPFTLGHLWLRALKGSGAQDRLDAFWVTGNWFPLGLPPAVARVMTVYDLVWRFYPETMSNRSRLALSLLTDGSIRAADRIIAISESTRRDLEERLGVTPERIRIVYPGVDESFRPGDPVLCARSIAQKYGVSENYICAVGTLEPRKNLITLVEAMRLLRDRGNFPYQLLVAGQPGWKTSGIYESVKRHGLTEREIRFLGHVRENDLPAFYSGARLFVFPSLYEGFGIPLVEAMSCGVPIVASNVSSIPEVVQDAAILVSPLSAREFADAIHRLSTDAGLRSSLVQKGVSRARDFSWETAAQQVLKVFDEVSRARARGQS